jgi:hypothetical protein
VREAGIMKSIIRSSFFLLITLFIFTGCNLGAQPPQVSTVDVAAESTSAFETISVTLTLGALGQLQSQPTFTKTPTVLVPSATEEPNPTMEPPIILPTDTTVVEELVETETPVPTIATDTPMLHVTESTNCRAGPSPMYGVEGYVTTDMTLPVRGINVGHSWWWVDDPTYPGYHCWVWKMTSVVEGDISNVPVYYDPWTPTPGAANISADISAWTGRLTGKCPMKVTAAAVIRTDQGGQVRYQWVKRQGVVIDKGWVTIAADSSAAVSVSFKVNHTGDGIVQLQILYPTRVNSGRVNYTVTCTN